MEELDLEALEPVPDLGSYAPPSAATAQDVQAEGLVQGKEEASYSK